MKFTIENLNKVEYVSIIILILGIVLFNFESTYTLGLTLLAVSGFSVIAATYYKNQLPPNKQEIESWKTTRKEGKNRYILKGLRFGLISFFLFLVFELGKSLWFQRPFFEFNNFTIIAAILIVLVGAPVFAAIEMWKFEEARYKEAVSQEDQT
jgi:hypothetical protein